jgi:hypothetical protein
MRHSLLVGDCSAVSGIIGLLKKVSDIHATAFNQHIIASAHQELITFENENKTRDQRLLTFPGRGNRSVQR